MVPKLRVRAPAETAVFLLRSAMGSSMWNAAHGHRNVLDPEHLPLAFPVDADEADAALRSCSLRTSQSTSMLR
jgi:hypothetical protein